LKYTEDRKTDQYGNQFRYRARLNPDKPTDAGKTAYDVFFVTLTSPVEAAMGGTVVSLATKPGKQPAICLGAPLVEPSGSRRR
jgi:hypothetical protein